MEERVLNKFERVIITAMRARELAEGVGVTPEMEGKKITSIAVDELHAGSLKFDADEEIDDIEDEDDEDDDKDKSKAKAKDKDKE